MSLIVNLTGSSLLNIAKEIEDMRSDKTTFHGPCRNKYLVDHPLYALFVVNCVTTVGNFLVAYYEEKYLIKRDASLQEINAAIPF